MLRLIANNPCVTCIEALGITDFAVSFDCVTISGELSTEVMDALQALISSPPCNHAAPNELQVCASNDWVVACAKLAALPPVPGEGEDPYATIRARLGSERDAALIRADSLGGLV